VVVDKYVTGTKTIDGSENTVHNWKTIRIDPAVMAAAIAAIFLVLFNDKAMVGQKKIETADT
jgi:hypothetical protein